jgi:hypothetical protein
VDSPSQTRSGILGHRGDPSRSPPGTRIDQVVRSGCHRYIPFDFTYVPDGAATVGSGAGVHGSSGFRGVGRPLIRQMNP